MQWRNRRQSGNIEDRRGAGGKIAGGGLGFLGLAFVVYLLGGDPSYLFQEGINRTINSATNREKIPDDEQDQIVKFVSVVLAETEDTWKTQLAAADIRYQEPTLVFFSGMVSSACGTAQSAMGPFYCPLDQKIYIDVNFFYDLANRHNASGDFAQAYVIAHEVGHHVQNILGVLEKANQHKARMRTAEANQVSVQTELMADCLAGVWANSIDNKGLLEEGDIKEALNAASQIGDDRLQEQAQGYAVQDSFTHGSSAQRYRAFNNGYNATDFNSCVATYKF